MYIKITSKDIREKQVQINGTTATREEVNRLLADIIEKGVENIINDISINAKYIMVNTKN